MLSLNPNIIPLLLILIWIVLKKILCSLRICINFVKILITIPCFIKGLIIKNKKVATKFHYKEQIYIFFDLVIVEIYIL